MIFRDERSTWFHLRLRVGIWLKTQGRRLVRAKVIHVAITRSVKQARCNKFWLNGSGAHFGFLVRLAHE
jgi:hypothetical protein